MGYFNFILLLYNLFYFLKIFFPTIYIRRSTHGVVANMLNCGLIVAYSSSSRALMFNFGRITLGKV